MAEITRNDLFLRACRRERVERTPVWIMRQAGRYLPEYRALREKADFLTSCRTPEIACEITLQPVRRLGVDAAILFSDILIPLPGMGVPVAFNPGPVIAQPIRTRQQIETLRVPDARETTPFVMDAVRLVRRELNGTVPLIGFAGAPFTVATYLAEGGGSKSFATIKKLLFAEPELAHQLLSKCADTIASYLSEQVRAGAQAAMLFDTWCGVLSPDDYATFALPYARRVFEAVGRAAEQYAAGSIASSKRSAPSRLAHGDDLLVGPNPTAGHVSSDQQDSAATPSEVVRETGSHVVPRIYYAGEAAGFLKTVASIGADVIGLDWRMGLDEARRRLGPALAIQGNLDPATLLGPPEFIRARTAGVLEAARAGSGAKEGPAPGHVFNLGHGILPETPVESAQVLIEAVRQLSSRSGS